LSLIVNTSEIFNASVREFDVLKTTFWKVKNIQYSWTLSDWIRTAYLLGTIPVMWLNVPSANFTFVIMSITIPLLHGLLSDAMQPVIANQTINREQHVKKNQMITIWMHKSWKW